MSERNRLMRWITDALRLSLAVGACAWAIMNGVAAGWGMGLVAITSIALRLGRPRPSTDLIFTALLAADAWLSTLGTFDHFNHGDHVGHLVLAAAVTLVLFDIGENAHLSPWRKGPESPRAAWTAAGLAVLLGILWEIAESASDALIGTNMSLGRSDTIGDLAGDIVGASLAALCLVFFMRAGRRSRLESTHPSISGGPLTD